MIRSIRQRLLMGTAAGIAIVLAISALVLYSVVSSAMYREFDASLASKARSLALLVEQTPQGIEHEFDQQQLHQFQRNENREYYQLWQGDDIVSRSPRLGSVNLVRTNGGAPDEPFFQSCALPDGLRGRQVEFQFQPLWDGEDDDHSPETDDDALGVDGQRFTVFSRSPVTLVVARDTSDVDRALVIVAQSIVAVLVGAVVVSLLVLQLIVSRGLRPLNQLADAIRQIDHQSLGTRLQRDRTPTELVPIVDRLNEMFGRLRAAFQRERSFSADVSHELRTPLTGLRANMEVALSQPRDSKSYRQTISQCLTISQQTQRMVDNLLNLARMESGNADLETGEVDVAALIHDCLMSVEKAAQARGISILVETPSAITIQSDRHQLTHVFANLFENAVAYVNDRGTVEIRAHLQDESVWIEVRNTGNQLSTEDAAHVFERFWRGDAARTNTELHSGLGLSLCQGIVTRLDGTIAVDCPDGGIFRVTVVIPSCGARNGRPQDAGLRLEAAST